MVEVFLLKRKNNSLLFMISIVVIVVGLLIGVGLISDKQEEEKTATLPTAEEYAKSFTGEITDFEYNKQPLLGDENAPVRIVEFGDFKCSHCASWEKLVFPDLYKDYIETGKVQFYFVNYQFLAMDSVLAGIAGEAIYEQSNDAFWQYYKTIYEKQGVQSQTWATEDFLIKLVRDNVKGIDYEKFEADLKEKKTMNLVRKDYVTGQRFGVSGTPAIFVNEKQVEGSYEAISKAIEHALKEEK